MQFRNILLAAATLALASARPQQTVSGDEVFDTNCIDPSM
jgi:hypothetical protein